MNMHLAEGGHQVLQEIVQANTHQKSHTLGRQGIPDVMYTEKRCQKCNIDLVLDIQTPIPSANIGRYNHMTGVLPSDIRRAPHQQILAVKHQD